MKTVLLAGGLGTRLSEETASIPKPMVEIGGRPILWHIMNLFAAQGFSEFVVALGHKGEIVKDYFLNFHARNADLTLKLGKGERTVHAGAHPDWTVHLVDTGAATQTGGRLKRLATWLGEREAFLMTYGDGVADIDIKALLAFHRAHGKLATVTAVRPPGRFGSLALAGNRVSIFAEKPQTGEGWINGGFFVLEPAVLDLIAGDETLWELEPLETLARRGELMAFRHEGFWQPMDTLRDKRHLEELWAAGRAPWKVWA
ncbi:MAG TPA: glucose-1-phosphate cytidylyltransferase [Thermoanaerobaculia bacterium]|nr:glucose-1-phosphate cytidylyltransferase [Thermoanaerobaculia bacterium]